MNIEELTKSQLLLLMILVNFVTSIATGILTVSLLDQAPPVVTQTVNQIVERTVKTVAPALPAAVVKSVSSAPAPSNEDLVTAALAAQDARTVLVYKADASTSTPALAVGTFLPAARAVVTAASDKLPKEAVIEFPDGSTEPVSLVRSSDTLALYGFSDSADLPKVATPKLTTMDNLKLGETVLAIRGDGSATTGIISQITSTGIHTTLPVVGAGVGAVDLAGNLVGIAANSTTGLFVGADAVTTLLTTPEATSTAPTATNASADTTTTN